jgi:hypothetical protein
VNDTVEDNDPVAGDSGSPTPSDLAQRVRQVREDMQSLSRTLIALAEAYDALPEPKSEADRAARIEIIDSLSDVRLALSGAADDGFTSAVQSADRLAAGAP